MLRVGVLVSGGGTNLQAVIDNIGSGSLDKVSIEVVISNKKNAYALSRAKNAGIQTCVLERKNYIDQDSYDESLITALNKKQIELVVLAGFMVILGKKFIEAFRNRIINVHPSLIPAFCGKGYYGIIPHREALAYGVKVSGATVHFVDEEADAGPIILQKAVDIDGIEDEYALQKKIMEECEWKILPKAIALISENRVSVNGRKVFIDKGEDDR
jgi:phosphoribosylglycinamide formyltransferase 1